MTLPDPKNFSMVAHTGSTAASVVLHDKEVQKQIKKEIDSLDHSLETFKYDPYREECLEIAPLWLFQEASPEGVKMFRQVTAWDEKSQTMIILIFSYEGKLISYKRRRFFGGKWITRKSTHPNHQCINGIHSNYGPIYVIEGHHDALTAMLLRQDEINSFNFLMIPTVSYQHFREVELSLLSGHDVYFLPDLGDKNSGSIKGMTKLAKQTEKAGTTNVRVVNLKTFLEENGIDAPGEKLDLSEAIFLWREGSSAFINTLLYHCDRGIVFDREVF